MVEQAHRGGTFRIPGQEERRRKKGFHHEKGIGQTTLRRSRRESQQKCGYKEERGPRRAAQKDLRQQR